VDEVEIQRAAKSTLRFCKKMKKQIKNFDHSSAAQTLRNNHRWEIEATTNFGLPRDHANNLGVSLRTMERGLISGRYIRDDFGRVKVNSEWKAPRRGRPSGSVSGIATTLSSEGPARQEQPPPLFHNTIGIATTLIPEIDPVNGGGVTIPEEIQDDAAKVAAILASPDIVVTYAERREPQEPTAEFLKLCEMA
jgi:hypothetical protein